MSHTVNDKDSTNLFDGVAWFDIVRTISAIALLMFVYLILWWLSDLCLLYSTPWSHLRHQVEISPEKMLELAISAAFMMLGLVVTCILACLFGWGLHFYFAAALFAGIYAVLLGMRGI